METKEQQKGHQEHHNARQRQKNNSSLKLIAIMVVLFVAIAVFYMIANGNDEGYAPKSPSGTSIPSNIPTASTTEATSTTTTTSIITTPPPTSIPSTTSTTITQQIWSYNSTVNGSSCGNFVVYGLAPNTTYVSSCTWHRGYLNLTLYGGSFGSQFELMNGAYTSGKITASVCSTAQDSNIFFGSGNFTITFKTGSFNSTANCGPSKSTINVVNVTPQ